ncbi:MAG: hypothetical protein J6A29_06115 [Clostridia bacterium]|nr:hypothetical protein [Clostridia bacterium]
MNKKIIIFCLIFILIICSIILIKNNYKSIKMGNNIINQSADKIKENILNIESYEAKVQITITSNKNTNTYEATQKYYKENSLYKQEIISPENLEGTTFEYDGTNLKIKNTKLNLSKIYESYHYIGSNELSLNAFIEDYNNNDSTDLENDEEIILETVIKNNNKYRKIKRLYISKDTKLPIKMEIQDNAQNTLVYILYNEIEINKLEKEQIN